MRGEQKFPTLVAKVVACVEAKNAEKKGAEKGSLGDFVPLCLSPFTPATQGYRCRDQLDTGEETAHGKSKRVASLHPCA